MARTNKLLRCIGHRHVVSSLLAAPLVLTGLVLVGTGVAGSPLSSGPGLAVQTLRDANSLAVEATLQYISFDDRNHDTAVADGYPSLGTYRYRALDQAWYAKSMLDPSRFVGMDNEIAFDGQVTFVARNGESQVSVSHSGEPRSVGMTLPNPLFALASWALPLGDHNLDAAVKLSDIRTLDDGELSIADSAWTTTVIDSKVYEVTRVAGDVLYGVPYVHEIVVPVGMRGEPVRIDRVTKNGQLITRFEFESWESVDSANTALASQGSGKDLATTATRLPRIVKLSEYRLSDGQRLHTAVFFMESIRVNAQIEPEELTVQVPPQQVVWDADWEEFVGP